MLAGILSERCGPAKTIQTLLKRLEDVGPSNDQSRSSILGDFAVFAIRKVLLQEVHRKLPKQPGRPMRECVNVQGQDLF